MHFLYWNHRYIQSVPLHYASNAISDTSRLVICYFYQISTCTLIKIFLAASIGMISQQPVVQVLPINLEKISQRCYNTYMIVQKQKKV